MEILKRNYVRYGIIMSAFVVICLFAMEVTGQNESFDKSVLTPLFTFIAPAIVWFFGIWAKKKMLKNKMTFKQGFVEGFKISLVFGLISPFIFMFYYLLVNPDILTYVAESYSLGNADTGIVIITDMVIQFVSAVGFGSVYAAIISFFLKSK